MQAISYNRELTYANVLFSQLFRNITILRKTNNTDKVEPINVLCVIGSRSRILKALENQQEKADFSLPLIVITRNGITRDPSRLANLHNEIRFSTNGKIDYNMLTPNPVNISYKVTLFAKYQSDIDLMLSNWIPFFNNDVWVSVSHYKYTDLKFYSQIVMNDSITESRNESPTNTQYDFCQAECTFTFKTYIFGGMMRVYSGLHPSTKPITMITTIYDPETSSEVTTVVTADPSDPNHNPEVSAEGFIPIVQSFHLDLHAVPRADPLLWDKYHVIKYLDIGTYFDEVDSGFITDPEYDCLKWMFLDLSAELDKNPYHNEKAPYQYKWTKGNMNKYNYRQ